MDKSPKQSKAQARDQGFDADALREKYRIEREKRLRPDGLEQYRHVDGDFAHFAKDPYVEPGFEREPLRDEIDVVLIGGGFGGLLTGARLRQLGVEGIRIIEKGGDVGGAWYWNRYPGVACDIESYVYMPLLEELEYIPTEKYSRGAEIFEHCKAIAEKFDLYREACLQTEVTDLRWDEAQARWIVSTDRGDVMKARFVCLANGFLQKPKLPGIAGIETFKGHVFHTSRWDYDYTGGDASGNLTGLQGKRVGIIGTGATAVQCVPHVGKSAGHLYVFQRTPSSVDVRNNRATDPDWAAKLAPGWHQARMDNFQTLTAGGFQDEDLVNDGWTDIIKNLVNMLTTDENADMSPEGLEKAMEIADFMKMEQIRARVDAIIEDPETAEALKPYYRQFCKRPCFHDEYLQTFNRDNVSLVDTQGQGVERITPQGAVVAGKEYELDCLIFATGFEVGTDYAQRAGYETFGRDGVTLTDKWAEGITTLHGMHIRNFPNCYMMGITQSGFTVNFPHMINEQAKHIAYIIERGLAQGIERLEVSEAAEREWVEAVYELGDRTTEFAKNCTPGYYNNEGKPSDYSRQNGFFFGEPTQFLETLQVWRASDNMDGLEVG